MTQNDWYVRYPSGKESQLVSIEEARVLIGMYGGGMHRAWSYGKPPKRALKVPHIVKMFML